MNDEVDRGAMVSDLRTMSADLRVESEALRADMRAELASVRSELSTRIDRLEDQLNKQTVLIAEEGATTRRHFNIMVEKVEAAVKIVAEVNAHHAVVLDNHETRLNRLEKPRPKRT